jgi:hypothetical protein
VGSTVANQRSVLATTSGPRRSISVVAKRVLTPACAELAMMLPAAMTAC